MADTKTTALTELTTPATTDLVYGVATPGGTPASRKIQVANLPLGFGAWTDYSGTSTIVGWGAFTLKTISYRVIGKTVLVAFLITGTSNSATTTFTLPSSPVFTVFAACQVKAGATYQIGIVSAPNATVTIYKDGAFGAFAATGDKEVYGEFWYVTS